MAAPSENSGYSKRSFRRRMAEALSEAFSSEKQPQFSHNRSLIGRKPSLWEGPPSRNGDSAGSCTVGDDEFLVPEALMGSPVKRRNTGYQLLATDSSKRSEPARSPVASQAKAPEAEMTDETQNDKRRGGGQRARSRPRRSAIITLDNLDEFLNAPPYGEEEQEQGSEGASGYDDENGDTRNASSRLYKSFY
ncbi:hypothetical protein B0T26DRAFT_670764 [Lasiosphaeria miniovina]|uniref:Uncharacterized protein n=1 Tax=Lasiosphaeria miniovina TaxID=1954250 RepID=A0AA40BHS4_9PEZI|nr:uncharacterized protein B0T26DRAFT_670764 [Lasiosphaeria miniovina]KAK0734471.1 hypothetical protein B0T26DRAFT_670764 [Lasiosphaeria miniovina]